MQICTEGAEIPLNKSSYLEEAKIQNVCSDLSEGKAPAQPLFGLRSILYPHRLGVYGVDKGSHINCYRYSQGPKGCIPTVYF